MNTIIRVDGQSLRRVDAYLKKLEDAAPKAISRAINHTLKVTRTEASKEIRKQVKLKAGYVRDKLAIRKATASNLSGAISTPSRGSLLTRYPHRQYKKGGIGVQVKPSGGKKKMPGAFFIRFENGNTGIAIRTKHGPGLGRSEGIDVLYGPSVSQVFTDVKDDLQQPSSNRLMERLNHEAQRLLER